MFKKYRIQILFTVVGLVGGYLILHPYTMLVYMVAHLHESGQLHLHWYDLAGQSIFTRTFDMVAMAVPFALFGAAVGFLIGSVVDRRRKLLEARYEIEKNEVALRTLKEVVVTMSHYLLNANMIIGGKVRQCRKMTTDERMLGLLDVIEEQGRRIDAVVTALRNLKEIKSADYTSSGQVKMVDISEELDRQMKQEQNADSE